MEMMGRVAGQEMDFFGTCGQGAWVQVAPWMLAVMGKQQDREQLGEKVAPASSQQQGG